MQNYLGKKLKSHVITDNNKIEISTARDKIGQNWRMERIKNWTKCTKLKIGQNGKMGKIENWTKLKKLTKLKAEQNWKLDKIHKIKIGPNSQN